jgi:hypothetical protein
VSLLDEMEQAARASLARMEDEPGGKSPGDSAALRAIAYSVFGVFQVLRSFPDHVGKYVGSSDCHCATCEHIRNQAILIEVAKGPR